MIEISLYNTFDRLEYRDRILLKYAMIDWCTDNIGTQNYGWSCSNNIDDWRKFFFLKEEDALAFKLAFSEND